jgi:hypothetical protein
MAATATVGDDIARAGQAYISGKSACDILACNYPRIRQLARDGAVRVRRLPGGHPRYSLADVLRVAEAAADVEPCEQREAQAVAAC